MSKPHKWAKEIKAWADGHEIEFFHRTHQKWVDAAETPIWELDVKYRIKPQPKEPQYLYVYDNGFEREFTTNRCGSVIKTDKPNTIYKYIGKIKLEQDDE